MLMMAHCPNNILYLTGMAGNATIDKVERNITAVQRMAMHDHIPSPWDNISLFNKCFIFLLELTTLKSIKIIVFLQLK